MTSEETYAKDKIFRAALELIADGEDARKITTRAIAAKAGTNPALVNYYYQSKENLLSQAVGVMMGGIIGEALQAEGEKADAYTRLKNILLSTADAAFKHHNACKIALAIELKRGCASSCEMTLPLLKEILPERSELDLHVIALQLMLPFHHIVLDPGLYGRYLGADFFDRQQRNDKIGQMLDCILSGQRKGN